MFRIVICTLANVLLAIEAIQMAMDPHRPFPVLCVAPAEAQRHSDMEHRDLEELFPETD